MNDHEKMARAIAEKVKEQGGRAFLVGGYVRDRILGIENKDLDLEIHGITPEGLYGILEELGTPLEMGRSFGVYGMAGYELDIAMPRKEKATGRGHRDFQVEVDPFLGTRKAARRRDFTVNAMMMDVLTGDIIDEFGGREDLSDGILRHVDEKTFIEDPLRVLRAAQFAARFGFTVSEETRKLCASMDLSYLPRERVYGELEKALLKAEKPSIFFEALREMNQLSIWFPELFNLIGLPQDPRWHPEGDVWNHTMLVIDEAAKLRSQAKHPAYFMLAALLHDFGKANTTTFEEDGRIRSIGHENETELVKTALKRLTEESDAISYALNMTRLHMRPNLLAWQNSGQKAFNRVFDLSVCPEDLILLSKADFLGQKAAADYSGREILIQERYQAFCEMMARPYVMGRDLIEAGLQPGKEFSEILAYAHKLRLSGVDKDNVLKQIYSKLQ